MDLGNISNQSFQKPQQSSQQKSEQAAAFGLVFNQKSAELQQSERVTAAEDLRKQSFRTQKDDIETGKNMDAEEVLEDLFDQKINRLKNTIQRLASEQHHLLNDSSSGPE